MEKESKKNSEIASFNKLFSRLKDWCDDAPGDLPTLSKLDPGIKKLCDELLGAAFSIENLHFRGSDFFRSEIDPSFLAAWRDYEERYASALAGIWLENLLPDLKTPGTSNKPSADIAWENANDEARQKAQALDEAIGYAKYNMEMIWHDLPADHFENIENGIRSWEILKLEYGFSLQAILRRRELIPFVLIPQRRGISQPKTQKQFMLTNLKQAHDAFVYGAMHAALGLMRSIMEAVLRDQYGAPGDSLRARIENIQGPLPRGVRKEALHRLRILANAILHLDQNKADDLQSFDEIALEKEIVAHLFVLRALIENVR